MPRYAECGSATVQPAVEAVLVVGGIDIAEAVRQRIDVLQYTQQGVSVEGCTSTGLVVADEMADDRRRVRVLQIGNLRRCEHAPIRPLIKLHRLADRVDVSR